MFKCIPWMANAGVVGKIAVWDVNSAEQKFEKLAAIHYNRSLTK